MELLFSEFEPIRILFSSNSALFYTPTSSRPSSIYSILFSSFHTAVRPLVLFTLFFPLFASIYIVVDPPPPLFLSPFATLVLRHSLRDCQRASQKEAAAGYFLWEWKRFKTCFALTVVQLE